MNFVLSSWSLVINKSWSLRWCWSACNKVQSSNINASEIQCRKSCWVSSSDIWDNYAWSWRVSSSDFWDNYAWSWWVSSSDTWDNYAWILLHLILRFWWSCCWWCWIQESALHWNRIQIMLGITGATRYSIAQAGHRTVAHNGLRPICWKLETLKFQKWYVLQ